VALSLTRSLGTTAALLALLAVRAGAWTDDPLRPGTTRIRAVHLVEIGQAVNARLGSCGFPRTAVPAPGARVRAADFNAARAAVKALYAAYGRQAPIFTGGDPLPPGVPVRAAHLAEIRAAVDASSHWTCLNCASDGSCSAPAPACGQTTTGVDNCGNSCSADGAPCAAKQPDCDGTVDCKGVCNGPAVVDNFGNCCESRSNFTSWGACCHSPGIIDGKGECCYGTAGYPGSGVSDSNGNCCVGYLDPKGHCCLVFNSSGRCPGF